MPDPVVPVGFPLDKIRIVVENDLPNFSMPEVLATACAWAEIPLAHCPSTAVGIAKAGDVWLCMSGIRREFDDSLQGEAIAFIDLSAMMLWLYPRLLARLAAKRNAARGKGTYTKLDPYQIIVRDRGGTCGPPREIEGLVEALNDDRIAISAPWNAPSADPSWLWFDRQSGRCDSSQFSCLSVDPADIASPRILPHPHL